MLNMCPDKDMTGMRKGLDSDTFYGRQALFPLYYGYIWTCVLSTYGNTSLERPVNIYFLPFCSSISCLCIAYRQENINGNENLSS